MTDLGLQAPTEPLCIWGEGEVGFAETPDGGITSSGRNGIFHGPGKCNCRGVVRSADGGTTFGELTFDPVRQLRHHFGPSLRDIWALYHPKHAVYCALLGYQACWMLIGACDPMF